MSEFGENADFSVDYMVVDYDPFEETTVYVLNPHQLYTFWSDLDAKSASGSNPDYTKKECWNQIGIGRIVNSRKNTDVIGLIIHQTYLDEDNYEAEKIYFNCDGENIIFERATRGSEIVKIKNYVKFPDNDSPISAAPFMETADDVRDIGITNRAYSLFLPDSQVKDGVFDSLASTDIAPNTLQKIADAENLEVRILKADKDGHELKLDLNDEDEAKIVETFKYFYHHAVDKDAYTDIQEKIDDYKKKGERVFTDTIKNVTEKAEASLKNIREAIKTARLHKWGAILFGFIFFTLHGFDDVKHLILSSELGSVLYSLVVIFGSYFAYKSYKKGDAQLRRLRNAEEEARKKSGK